MKEPHKHLFNNTRWLVISFEYIDVYYNGNIDDLMNVLEIADYKLIKNSLTNTYIVERTDEAYTTINNIKEIY